MCSMKEQQPVVLYKKGVSKNSQDNTCVEVSYFNQAPDLRPATLKKMLRHVCFPVNSAKFLKKPPGNCCYL